MNYGERLTHLRERLGITQKHMANILNIDPSLYRRYEKELQTIPNKHLIKVADYFEVSIDYLFNFTNIKCYPKIHKDFDIKKICERLKEFRKENNLTQELLAEILNTTQSVIADYERGRYLLSTPNLYTISNKYQISADYLLGKIDKKITLKKATKLNDFKI